MAYSPSTLLSYVDTDGSEQTAMVLSGNMVMCLKGRFNNIMLKLIDWLILAAGREKVLYGPADPVKYFDSLMVKAGLTQSNPVGYNDPYEKHY